jgi:hypothetical protein
MNAVVLDPAGRVLHHAMGAVPATDASWQQLRLEPSP